MHQRLIAMMLAASESTGGGGGGGGGCGVVLATPYDDNFDCGTALDITGTRFAGAVAWTKRTTTELQSEAIVADEWRVETTSNGSGFDPAAAYQTVPSGDWTIETSCYMNVHGTNPGDAFSERIGLYLAESSTGKELEFGAAQDFWSGGWNYGVQIYSTASASLAVATIPAFAATRLFDVVLRLSRVSGTLTFDYSLDSGGSWSTLTSVAQATQFTTAPDRWGVMKQNSTPNVGNNYGYFRYFHRTA